MTQKDIVRHKLVTRIVEAYDRYDQKAAALRKKPKRGVEETPIFTDLLDWGDN